MAERCPRCDGADVELLEDTVDIGVGVLKNLRGVECRSCGQLAVRDCCRTWAFQDHAPWCQEQEIL